MLSGIPLAHMRREHSTFKLVLQAQLNTSHPLHTLVHNAQFHGTQRLHSRRPFSRHAAALVNSGFNLLESWNATRESATPLAQFLVNPAFCFSSGSEQPRSLWVALNRLRLRTGVGRFGTCLYRRGMLDTPKCICGAEQQSANNIIFDCNILRPPSCLEELRSRNIKTLNG